MWVVVKPNPVGWGAVLSITPTGPRSHSLSRSRPFEDMIKVKLQPEGLKLCTESAQLRPPPTWEKPIYQQILQPEQQILQLF